MFVLCVEALIAMQAEILLWKGEEEIGEEREKGWRRLDLPFTSIIF